MARQKKNGRFINYYIDRNVFERLERYAQIKGQSMTTAIERILGEYLDSWEKENILERGMNMYCPKCNLLVEGTSCPVCGNTAVSQPAPDDYCFLTEKELLWAGALRELLQDHKILFQERNTLGAGLTAKIGSSMERVKFYVPFRQYYAAKELEQAFFSSEYEPGDF